MQVTHVAFNGVGDDFIIGITGSNHSGYEDTPRVLGWQELRKPGDTQQQLESRIRSFLHPSTKDRDTTYRLLVMSRRLDLDLLDYQPPEATINYELMRDILDTFRIPNLFLEAWVHNAIQY